MKDAVMQIVKVDTIKDYIEGLTELLVKVVEDGASIGFLTPFSYQAAKEYWATVLSSNVHLWVAVLNGQVVGTVQLQLCSKANGVHRAEIAKLMTLPQNRRAGIGRTLMNIAEATAWSMGRTLLILDTREGDNSNYLYRSIGYKQAGLIPAYAKSVNGSLDATVIYYKQNEALV